MPRIPLVFLVVALCVAAVPARAQTPSNVLVVANSDAPGSVEIARHYVNVRSVPPDQLVELKTATTPEVSRRKFEGEIVTPLVEWIARHNAQDRILYIVLTRGMPVRVVGTLGRDGSAASVDSELTLLYRRMTGAFTPITGPIPNPYFAVKADALKPFSHVEHDIYLVTRLDGFTVADAMALIDRAASPAHEGRILLDEPKRSDVRSTWLDTATQRLEARGFTGRVTHDVTPAPLTDQTGVLGYASWGSNDPALHLRQPGLAFVPGALATMFLSTDARTFLEPSPGWEPGGGPAKEYAGSSQSLVADLVRAGVTGAAGNVAEPYLDGSVRPDILFPAYVAGFNLAESFYLALPFLSWQSVVIGDPLCAPFRPATLVAENTNPPIDPDTELPALYSARRLAAGAAGSGAALKPIVQAETRMAQDNAAGAVESLKRAVELEPRSIIAWRFLGVALEAVQKPAEARTAYTRVLELDRNDVVALNNLANITAVYEKRPGDALPLAERAAALDSGNGVVQDTLGWIHHLLGEDQEAAKLLTGARQAEPGRAEIQLHAAVVFDLVGRRDDATKALQAAEALDASLKDRTDVQELLRRLNAAGQSKG